MVERDDWHNSRLNQIVHEFNVVVYGLLVHWIISSAEWDDSWPGNAESVCLCTKGFEEADVFGCTIVGVAGYAAIGAVADLAGRISKGIPYAG